MSHTWPENWRIQLVGGALAVIHGLEVVGGDPLGDVGADLGALLLGGAEVEALEYSSVDGLGDDVRERHILTGHLGGVGHDHDEAEGDRLAVEEGVGAVHHRRR